MSKTRQKIFKGNYRQVVEQLQDPLFAEATLTENSADKTAYSVGCDIPRSKVLCASEQEQASILQQTANSNISHYTQGDFDGGIFACLHQPEGDYAPPILEHFEKNAKKDEAYYYLLTDNITHRFTYQDDAGQICGLTIFGIDANHFNEATPNYVFKISLIKNVVGSLDEREVILVSDPLLISKKSQAIDEVDMKDALSDLKNKINNEKVCQVLEDLYQNNLYSEHHLDETLVAYGFYPLEMKDAIERIKQLEKANFYDCLEQLRQKAGGLSNRGYPTEGKEASDVADLLENQKRDYIAGKIKLEEFTKKCGEEIKKAKKGSLKQHHKFFHKVWHHLSRVFCFLLCGAVPIFQTKSMFLLGQAKSSVKSLNKLSSSPTPRN